jgi:hypothetical protein
MEPESPLTGRPALRVAPTLNEIIEVRTRRDLCFQCAKNIIREWVRTSVGSAPVPAPPPEK